MQITGHRAVYTSAYVGSSLAVLTSVFLSLVGFYLVKNALDRDIQTRVGQILATTPLTKALYTLSKALSNFAVLSIIVAVMALAAGVMQLVRHEDTAVHVAELLAPFIFVTLPVMALVASIAILFETVRWLRGGLGNVAYFFLWLAALSALIVRYDALRRGSFNDVLGLGTVVPSLSAACEAAFPGCTGTAFVFSAGLTFKGNGELWDLKTFPWHGVHWTAQIVLGRLLWIGVAARLALLAAVFFDRFDPARERVKRAQLEPAELPQLELGPPQPAFTGVSLSNVHPAFQQFSFRAMVVAELRLALKGVSLWWYLVGRYSDHRRARQSSGDITLLADRRMDLASPDLVRDGNARSASRDRAVGLFHTASTATSVAGVLARRRDRHRRNGLGYRCAPRYCPGWPRSRRLVRFCAVHSNARSGARSV